MGDEIRSNPTKNRIVTSEGLSTGALWSCRIAALVLIGAGITSTFLAGTGAAPASMILFGSLFLVIALMQRVPLSLEVGGARFDASYEADAAFDTGREIGIQRGVESALGAVEKAEQSGESPQVALERRLREISSDPVTRTWRPTVDVDQPTFDFDPRPVNSGERGYRGPIACSAADISYRQLEYWARTGLLKPSIRRGGTDLYSERDVVVLTVIKRLLGAGISLQQIRAAVAHLRDRGLRNLERVTLLSDGESVYEATSNDEVIDLLASGDGVFGISMAGVLREVRAALREMPPDDDARGAPMPVA